MGQPFKELFTISGSRPSALLEFDNSASDFPVADGQETVDGTRRRPARWNYTAAQW
ncbi:hypothetical protein SBA5_1140013 [Candidatus Sulfotelmatomonas gaucii]|uniref:Uncharacterized protein n=1 Tax=Candidatus Sulfuritelmatomonas gaucii TaxID=2043161 RepID=A0A2N9L3T4_9BACT|nr:hypothetical protein SBA5_1140013 [Candidatus Sulfotelmatomonas gaucii]